MADIRYDNMFWSPGGFNIQSGEPIDSRMYVADINHIYSADNWKKVKPYPGLIVSAPDGEVRICVNADFTLESSWKKIGGGAVSVETYAEAVALATPENVGQVIYVSTSSEYDADGEGEEAAQTYDAAPYIVTGNGTLQKLAASSASGDVTSDISALQTKVGNLENDITRIDGVIADKANNADVEQSFSTLETSISNTYLTKDSAGTTYLSKTDASTTYVDKTTYDAKVQEIATTTGGLRTDVDALKSAVGVEASGETEATGLYKEIEDLKADITAIPKFDILPVDALPSEGSESTVYLVKDKESDGDLYTEYIFVNGAWENLGKQTVDLSGYSTTTEMNSAITTAIEDKIAGYYTKGEVDAALANKADSSLLSNYVLSSTLTTDYLTKTQVETALADKADKTALSNYVETTTAELTKKADATALNDYLKIADIDANLTEYVKQESLNNQLKDYVTSTTLNTTLGDYVLASALDNSSSIKLVDGVYEVNAISDIELNEIITSSSNVTE